MLLKKGTRNKKMVEKKEVDRSIGEKTMYVEGSGLFRLIKDNLTLAETVVIQGEVDEGKYGDFKHWYRVDEDGDIYSMWQRIRKEKEMDNDEIEAVMRVVAKIIRQKKPDVITEDSKEIKEIGNTTKEIRGNIATIQWKINLLCVLVAGVYILGGIDYLKYINKADDSVIVSCLLICAAIISVIVWLKCETETRGFLEA